MVKEESEDEIDGLNVSELVVGPSEALIDGHELVNMLNFKSSSALDTASAR